MQSKKDTQYTQQSEILLLEKENFYLKNIIKDFPSSIYWKDINGVYLGRNLYSAQISKKLNIEPVDASLDSVVGKTDYDYFTKEVADQYRKHDLEVMETGKELMEEEVVHLPNGQTITQLSIKKPLYNKNGEVVGVIGNTIDITDRKRAEEYRLKHEATKKVLNLSNLIAGSIAHELRLPLGGIRVSMEVLQGTDFSKIPPQEGKEFLNKTAEDIIKVVDATTHVVNDMLIKVRSFATGEIHHSDFETISITADIEYLLETYPFENNEQELVKVSYGARFKYVGDKVLTAHVLGNLLKNALHAIKETDKTDVDITIETKTEGDNNLLIFRDTATGVSKDFLSKMFDTFETKKTTHGGTGLGLAFCKMVMEDCYGGSITCNSEEGKYTEFVLSFPKIK